MVTNFLFIKNIKIVIIFNKLDNYDEMNWGVDNKLLLGLFFMHLKIVFYVFLEINM